MTPTKIDEEKHGVGLFMRLLRLPQAIHYGRNFKSFPNIMRHTCHKNSKIIFKYLTANIFESEPMPTP